MKETFPWWMNGVIYQVYPKSFQDSSGNGYGDLNGICQRLDYLEDLGVAALWLTPVYLSPQVDNGYDVADYYAIDPAYGTMADFERLVAEAHRRGIRIVMDMVFNHTSVEHPWFRAAQDPASPYRPFYLWHEGHEGTPPNNWRSKFGGSAWQWHAQSGQYYLHLFAPEQADLNWQHPPVREALKKICHFWADKGVDGLRLDVINLVSKPQAFVDDEHGDGRRFYTDGPRIHQLLQEMNRDVFSPRGLMTVGEMSSTTLDHCQQYAATDGGELSMTFNFHHLKVDYPNGEKWALAAPDFVQLKQIFSQWQRGMHSRGWNALFWCNHDQPRIVSRFGDEGELRETAAKMLAMVLHGMQGTPYIYQGEEIGMTNPGYARIDQYRDVESLNICAALREAGRSEEEVRAILASKSRDNSRSPMQWDNSASAGFTSGRPWLDCAHNYPQVNAASARGNPDSVFYTYRRLIALRKELHILTSGDYQDLAPEHPLLWCYQRCWQGKRLLVVANLGREPIDLQAEGITLSADAQLLIANYADAPVGLPTRLRPFESAWWLDKWTARIL
ncbi:alpha,alpha-phosphotrehalase [Erwinia psidii]|uniref:Alpha,alpha-phosphotrehalase n=1 Tax=Erwinia psidii TaxID=69224 RepID=A0A3N6TXJ3_9GAMM|nr:alpha,alpha-phosphotrehalase [Erwinia psidii]MCX8956653.1 alpha,alpha-phosphotrehalase [Erwinia psidii]MCX8965094.1 alpha,alpha-phosphotrehalase [Erwinia psidii]RQM39982.1 alpha,alpha-phosphotrehalase [Erwinia psidii]